MYFFTNNPSDSQSSDPTLKPSNLPDEDLIAGISAGNETAFAELHARYQKRVAYLVRRHFQRADEVEEMVHLIFIEIWTGLHKFRGDNAYSFAAWLARVATNTCYDELRRQQRRREYNVSQLSDDESVALQHPATENRIEQTTVARDLLDKLLTGLEPSDRQVFVMLKAQDHSIAEISLVTGWSEAKIKMRIRRSRSILQRRSRQLI